jgi:prephenate dehydrogenase
MTGKPYTMASAPPFRRAAIIGTGLIGGSFALALRHHFPDTFLVGFDRPEVLDRALARGAIQEAAASIENTVREADLVYVALPVGETIESLPAIANSAEAYALVTDAASTKRTVCKVAQAHFAKGACFLGGHPMAGKEQSGIDHAEAKLFRGAPYVLIGSQENSDERCKKFSGLLRDMGVKPVWCDADTHDWAVGIVSHVPQLLSLALARVVQDETDETGLPLSLAGQGLQDMLRLSGSSYAVWRDILLTNIDNVSRALDRLTQAIDFLRTHLSSKELEQEFESANELHKLLRGQD